jgi:hypothetical protein
MSGNWRKFAQIKENEMRGLCSMHGRDEKFVKKKKL